MAEVLLLEDMEPFRRMLAHALRDDGHDVTHSGDGVISYERALMEKIEVMITDIDMPRVNGIEAILVAQKLNPNLKIIAMSGGGSAHSDDYLEACSELGVTKIFRKPFDTDALVAAVRSA